MSHADIAFEASGGRLPRDHSLALWIALERAEPRLAYAGTLAVLPIRAASAGEQGLVLARRSRLLMRLPEASVGLALGLCGRRLELAGACIELGRAKTRPLAPHPTLYAHRVAAENASEEAFVRQVADELGRMGIHSEFIVGKRSGARGPGGELTGFSLMLANLAPAQSLALQAAGLGAHRRLGFGIFVGHK